MHQYVQVFVGMGSNMDEPVQQIKHALQSLRACAEGATFQCSPLYRTRPVGVQDQADFINAVAGFKCDLSAPDLLQTLHEIEKAQGRRRSGEQWGPRTLDLDLLLYGEEVIKSSELSVPHPRIRERAFVLAPLHDLAPALKIPGQGQVKQLLAATGLDGVNKIDANT